MKSILGQLAITCLHRLTTKVSLITYPPVYGAHMLSLAHCFGCTVKLGLETSPTTVLRDCGLDARNGTGGLATTEI